MTIKLKNVNFTAIKNPVFWGDVDTNNILIPNKVSPGKRNYKFFIGYVDDDCKIKPFSVILPKTSAYVNGSDG